LLEELHLLYEFRQAYEPSEKDKIMSQLNEKRPQDWSLEERFQIILKCEGLKENEVSRICREQGIHQHHLSQWKAAFTSNQAAHSRGEKAELKALKNENKLLKREVNRKDKALAETAALLVLQKKVHAIWGTNEDDLL
jgi:transposase